MVQASSRLFISEYLRKDQTANEYTLPTSTLDVESTILGAASALQPPEDQAGVDGLVVLSYPLAPCPISK